jgi:hypothetical protein
VKVDFDEGAKLAVRSVEFDKDEVFELIVASNPESSVLVLSVEDEVAHSPGLTWDVECFWYVVETSTASDAFSSWALFTIDWDDNWGRWRRTVECGITGQYTKEQAASLLMERYFIDRNFDPENEFWSSLFQPFLQSQKD